MNVYFISGLGADRRAFDKIRLSDADTIHHIDWLEPGANETLPDYARRMSAGIDTRSPFALVGLSFGGLLSIEISKQLPAQKVFLISSISNRSELPWYFRMSGRLHLHHTGFVRLLKSNQHVMYWFFGTKSSKLQAYLTERIMATSHNYLQWSLEQITRWPQETKPFNVVHLHGTADKLFPIRYVKPDYAIERGSHFMVVTHAREISAILQKELMNLS